MVSSENKKLIEDCKKRWCVNGLVKDKVIEHFEKVIGDFLGQFDYEEKKIIISLIDKFEYYGQIRVNNYFSDIYDILSIKNKWDEDETIFLPIEKEDKANSSEMYTNLFVLYNRINYWQCVSIRDEEKFEKWKIKGKRIIIIDDFCGSGNTLKGFIEKYRDKFKGKEIYYIVIHAMKEGKMQIEELKYESIIIKIFGCEESNKAFDGNETCRKIFGEISKKYGLKKEEDIFGYEETEALVAFNSNTPNNTLGIFCKKNKCNSFPIFPRKYDPKPIWQNNKEQTKKRANERYGV